MHNLNAYKTGGLYTKPEWNPSILKEQKRFGIREQRIINHYSEYPIIWGDDIISAEQCASLIRQFDDQIQYPVGIDGFANTEENAGSHRAMAWGTDFADVITKQIHNMVPIREFVRTKIGGMHTLMQPYKYERKDCPGSYQPVMATPFEPEERYELLGSTPWLRFMKYADGGMHTPHYDAPFVNTDERYTTLFSWVLYLNTPSGTGGNFQFVKDHQHHIHPMFQDRSDWTEMSNEVIMSVSPKQGRLLIFPHWLCHQVEKYVGDGHRYIIRGDVAYGF